MSTPDYPSSSGLPGSMPERVRDDTADLAQTAQKDLADLGEEVKEQAALLGEEAKAQFDEVAAKTKGMASEQKQLLAGQLDGVSRAFDKVAGELESQDDSSAHYVRMIADGAQRLTSTVRDHDVDDILAMVQDFGRKQPAAFIGAAALIGFAASRFVRASASRRDASDNRLSPVPRPSYAPAATPNAGDGQVMGGPDDGI